MQRSSWKSTRKRLVSSSPRQKNAFVIIATQIVDVGTTDETTVHVEDIVVASTGTVVEVVSTRGEGTEEEEGVTTAETDMMTAAVVVMVTAVATGRAEDTRASVAVGMVVVAVVMAAEAATRATGAARGHGVTKATGVNRDSGAALSTTGLMVRVKAAGIRLAGADSRTTGVVVLLAMAVVPDGATTVAMAATSSTPSPSPLKTMLA